MYTVINEQILVGAIFSTGRIVPRFFKVGGEIIFDEGAEVKYLDTGFFFKA